jgi:NAD(P)H-hydrate epimerase
MADAQADALWQLLPHVVLQRRLGCNPGGSLLLAQLASTDLERLDAVLLGPGLGPLPATAAEQAEQAAWTLLQSFSGLLVLDADGLNRTSVAWLRGRRGPTWITPHQGELRRLWPDLADLPPLLAASRAAADSGAAVLLKGARSVIAAPDGRRWQLLASAQGSARAGLGDVLAGYAAGRGALALAGRPGVQADDAWLAAAALDHALAGLAAVERHGPGGASPPQVAQTLAQRPWSQERDKRDLQMLTIH